MTTTEKNVLIAEFMGGKRLPNSQTIRYNDYQGNDCHIDELAYDSDWNWLMLVIEKVFDESDENDFLGDITHALVDININETHKEVAKFIQDYNDKN